MLRIPLTSIQSLACTALLLTCVSVVESSYLFCTPLTLTMTAEHCQEICNDVLSPFCPEQYCLCAPNQPPTLPASNHFYCTAKAEAIASSAWCDLNCNRDPSFCPTSLCSCISDVPNSGPEDPLAEEEQECHSVQEPATDSWCTSNCNAGYCPSEFCLCGNSTSTPETGVYYGTCIGYTDYWCTSSCTHNPPFCPSCCSTSPSTTVEPIYYANCSSYSDTLCTAICNDYPSSCPASCCSLSPPTPSVAVQYYSVCDGPDVTTAYCNALCPFFPYLCPSCCATSPNATVTTLPLFKYFAVPVSVDASCEQYTSSTCDQFCTADAAGCPGCCYMAEYYPLSFYATCPILSDDWCTTVCVQHPDLCPLQCCSWNNSMALSSPTPQPTANPFYATCEPFTDAWCTSNCNHNPPACPSCCSGSNTGDSFVSVCPGYTNSWCNSVCVSSSGYCPTSCCTLSNSTAAPVNRYCTGYTMPWCNAVCSYAPSECPVCCEPSAMNNTHFNSSQSYVTVSDPYLEFNWHAEKTCLTFTDKWCTDVCNHYPSACPLNCCYLNHTTVVSGTNSTSNGYYANPFCFVYTDEWCTASCLFSPSTCQTQCCSSSPYAIPGPESPKITYYSHCPLTTDEWCTSTCTMSLNACPSKCCSNSSVAPESSLWVAVSSCRPVFTDSWCTERCNVAGGCHACCQLANVYEVHTLTTAAMFLTTQQVSLVEGLTDVLVSDSLLADFASAIQAYLLGVGADGVVSVTVTQSSATIVANKKEDTAAPIAVFGHFDIVVRTLGTTTMSKIVPALRDVPYMGKFVAISTQGSVIIITAAPGSLTLVTPL